MALKHINHSIMLLKHDVESLRQGGLPLTVACLLLACAEALQHRMTNALIHLQGAFGAFATTRKALPSSNATTPSSDSSFDSNSEDDDTIFTFRKMDLQLMTFALGNAPLLPSPPNLIFTAADLASPERSLFQVLHSAYQFASSTTQFFYKYLPDTRRPSNLYVEQGRHITNLRTWLAVHGVYPDGFRSSDFHGTLSSTSRGTSEEITQNLIFTSQALSCLIYLSTLLHPTETIYDDFEAEFQQIVQCVSAVLEFESNSSNAASGDDTANQETNDHPNRSSKSRPKASIPSRTNTFTPELGVIQPVFFTALKYRHPVWRRKAIALLLRCGREGPWWGELEAACASMAIRAEERAARKAILEKTKSETDPEPMALGTPRTDLDHVNEDNFTLDDAIRSMGFNDDNDDRSKEGRYHPGHSHNDPNYHADYEYLDDDDDNDPHAATTTTLDPDAPPTNRPLLLAQRISHLPSQPPWVLSLSPSSIPEPHRVCGDTIWDVTELEINGAKFPGDGHDQATYPGHPGAPSRPYGIGALSVSNTAGSSRSVAQYITVQLSRCLDIDGLVRSEESEDEKREKFWEFSMVKTRFA